MSAHFPSKGQPCLHLRVATFEFLIYASLSIKVVRLYI